MKKIIVNLNKRSYPIFIGKNILSDKSLFYKVNKKNLALITNKKIEKLHISKIKNAIKLNKSSR